MTMHTNHVPNRESLLVGLIGSGIQLSRTPLMHEQEGAEQGLHYVYRKIDLDRLGLGSEALPDLLDSLEFLRGPARRERSREMDFLEVVLAQQGPQRPHIAEGDCPLGQSDPAGVAPGSEMAVDTFANQPRHTAQFALRQREPELGSLQGRTRMQRGQLDQCLGEPYRRRQLQVLCDLCGRSAQPATEQSYDREHRIRGVTQFACE